MQHIGRLTPNRLLVMASCLLLAATAYLYITYGRTAYFVAFHRPFHFVTHDNTAVYTPPALPHFDVTSTIASTALSPGDVQTITVTETPSRSVQGYVQVWIQSPGGTISAAKCAKSCYDSNVYQNNTTGKPVQFTKGKTATFTYSYTLPNSLRLGTYQVSDIITSTDTFTDYYVHNDFARFNVQ